MADTAGPAGRRVDARPQLRIAKDLYDWLDQHARANDDGLTSRSKVAEEAIRRYRDQVRAHARAQAR